MTGKRPTGMVPAMLLLASLLPSAMAQTPIATIILPASLPASCTPLATLLSEYPPPQDGRVVDDALNEGIETAFSRYQATAASSATPSLDHSSLCDFIISTQIPSATPSATSALSSYISAAGIWLEDHGLEQARSLHSGNCTGAVRSEDELARGALDFVVAFGPCYKWLAWDQRTSSSSASAAATTTTNAISAPTATPSGAPSVQVTPSPTGQPSGTASPPPSAGSKGVADAVWVLGTTVCAILLLW